jgi:N-acyl-D-aspartate/D-glutamate deacylase
MSAAKTGSTPLDLTIEDHLEIEFILAQQAVAELVEAGDDRAGGRRRPCRHAVTAAIRPIGSAPAERQAMPLERGARLTAQPADFFGLKDRGRLKPGYAADIAIFDPETVGSSHRGERRYDLPGGAKRMVMPSRGIEYTIVNGVVTWEHGTMTGTTAGQVLRG